MSSSAEPGSPAPGRFITLEGGEGAGKSTQARVLASRLRAIGQDPLTTREPGGTPKAEALREALLSGAIAPFGPAAEAIAFSAARIDHLDRKIIPALEQGRTVICDRFVDSTRAYQGALGRLDPTLIAELEQVAVGRYMPDLTLVLDVPGDVGLSRAAARREQAAAPDRFEAQDSSFHVAIRRAFLEIALRERDRCVVIDAARPPTVVADAIWQVVLERLFPRALTPVGARA